MLLGDPQQPGRMAATCSVPQPARHKLLTLARPQVLEGSPWLQSRRLSVLAVMDPSGEGATTFTMRTSVRRPRVEAEITKVRACLSQQPSLWKHLALHGRLVLGSESTCALAACAPHAASTREAWCPVTRTHAALGASALLCARSCWGGRPSRTVAAS